MSLLLRPPNDTKASTYRLFPPGAAASTLHTDSITAPPILSWPNSDIVERLQATTTFTASGAIIRVLWFAAVCWVSVARAVCA